MVRAHAKHLVTKTANKNLRSSNDTATQQQITGMIWVCKFNNCNKKFVREADLKRHQATSIAHRIQTLCMKCPMPMFEATAEILISKPSSCCPQCGSTFTRTDALKRYQRSRHNSGQIDTIASSNNGSIDGETEGSATPAPQSRSQSPGQGEGLNQKSSHSQFIPVPTIMTQPEAPGRPTGTQSYYAPDMVNAVFIPSRVLDCKINSQDTRMPRLSLPSNFRSWASNTWVLDGNKANRLPTGTVPYTQTFSYGLSDATTTSTHINSAAPPQSDSSDGKGNDMASLINQPLDFISNIDPSLQRCATTVAGIEEKSDDSGAQRGREADTLAAAGLSPDVQNVLKAVLAFDADVEMAQRSFSKEQTESTEPIDKKYISSDSVPPLLVHQNVRDIDQLGSDGRVDTEERMQKEHSQDHETLPLPEGIRELINEDSLSYAPAS
ncbi:hypothetical protein ACEPAI_3387 [Sanghuangporus weigelae]